MKNKKNDAPAPDADTEDPLEVGKTVEAAQLTLAKVLTYQVPEYNELEIVGKFRWKVSFIFRYKCILKLLPTQITNLKL